MSGLDIALAQAALGRSVFPVTGKTPLVHWKQQATAKPNVLKHWWRVWPDAGVGWRLPDDVIVVDVDDQAAFVASGRPVIGDVPSQQTTRGWHYLFEAPGAIEVKQGPIPGGDLKVGGKGYVKIYHADAFTTGTLETLPGWYVQARGNARRAAVKRDPYLIEEIGTRVEILEWLGRIATYVGLHEKEYYGLLLGAAASGRIVDLDETRPWTEADLKVLAREAAAWAQGDKSVAMRVRINPSQRKPWGA